jgi:hypothetical protein
MLAQLQITLGGLQYKRAEKLAQLSGRPIAEMVPVLVMLAVPAFTHPLNFDRPVSDLPDEDILAIANLQMLPEIDARHSELVHAKGSRQLTDEEENEVRILNDVAGIGLIYKSEALVQCVKRGLPLPFES